MSKFIYAGVVALVITGSSFPAYSQAASVGDARKQLTASELENLTDARIAVVKFALQLTPEQEKNWAAVEEAIRARAAGRQARLANKRERAGELGDKNAIEMVRDRDPIAFLNRRADALAQRAAELKRLAAAWQPLYETLSAEQKRRLGVMAVLVIREVKDETEVHLLRKDDDED
jgi:hypothetical protein